MNVLFDKAAYEKGRSLNNEFEGNNSVTAEGLNEQEGGAIVERAIKDSLVSGKVGSLTVDPNYLDFRALECNNKIFNLMLFIYFNSTVF